MKRILLLLPVFFFMTAITAVANTIVVKNIDELNAANKNARPGDIVILQNGEWKDVNILLNCNGTVENPVTFKAQEAGSVIITGHSLLRIGGNYIIVDGFYFTNGYAGDDPVINFRANKNELANHCRVTNTVINGFNNPKRMNEGYWISFYGKNNRIDHCSFFNKKNMGVMMAVILDDERSRENFHSIDHNYFGFRLPLASNTGETLRVGVSQQCEFNSNTQITDNFFEHCDGETEIISLKSGSNVVRNNLFKECQGAVVLRHGNFNTVENNIFLGNNKEGTGGVRVINKGQWVVNNLFYQCRGVGFRSPLSIMNGVPNSPAFRYVSVSDAVIANNSFFECSPISFCEGSDTERSEPPKNTYFLNNLFYTTHDSLAYRVYDDISGIKFSGNVAGNTYKQQMTGGFSTTTLSPGKYDNIAIPAAPVGANHAVSDSIQAVSQARISHPLSATPGFSNAVLYDKIKENAYNHCGAAWFDKSIFNKTKPPVTVNCKTTAAIAEAIATNNNAQLTLRLTGKKYSFEAPLIISTDVTFVSAKRKKIKFKGPISGNSFLIEVMAGNTFSIKNMNIDFDGVNAATIISTDTSGSSNHSNFAFTKCQFSNIKGSFFNAARSSLADSIIIHNCSFINGRGTLFNFSEETGKKGYYNVEKLIITKNSITKQKGPILTMLRTGNDESTLGPYLIFEKNKISNSSADEALIYLYGTQRSVIEKNTFINSNSGTDLIKYEDIVRANHLFTNNILIKSGKLSEDQFVKSSQNEVR